MTLCNPYSHFLNQVILCSKRKGLFFDSPITNKTKKLAQLLLDLNVIRRFFRTHDENYRVFPAYTRYRKFNRSFKLYSRVSGKIILSYKALRLLNLSSPHSYYILETGIGLMTHKEAIKHRVGGVLLLIIR